MSDAHAWPVVVHPVYGCWVWQAKLDRDGYPVIWNARRPHSAHREVYTTEAGPIPVGLFLDHLCRNRTCVAPHHLEPVTRNENEMRKSYSYRARRMSCPRGHAWPINSIMTEWGGRACRACNRAAEGNQC